MIAEESLRDLLSEADYSRQDKVLLCLAVDSAGAKSVASVRKYAVDAGLTEAKRWNVADVLARAKGLAVKTKDGWELTSKGRRTVTELAGNFAGTVAPRVAAGLRHHLSGIADPQTKAFVEEAVSCFESGYYRAAVVLSWVGAIAVFQDDVLAHHLASFNSEASRRNAKWKPAIGRDGLARMDEYDFLQCLEAIGVIGKSVKHSLEASLKLRNGCGHPNSLVVGEAVAAAHLETLILNVFARSK